MKKLITFSIIFVFLAAICAMSSAHAEGWKKSYHAGSFDADWNYLRGNEMMFLTPHKGKLYAGTRMLYDAFNNTSAQIIVKESVTSRWRLSYEAGKGNLSIDSLKSVIFTTDAEGNSLENAVAILVAGFWNFASPSHAYIAMLDESKNQWSTVDLNLSNNTSGYTTTRALGFHQDRVTGVDRVFAGVSPSGIYSGVFDQSAPGSIAWEKAPEFSGFNDRVISFGECNGELYAAIKPAIYKRIEGQTPSWIKVYEYPLEKGWDSLSSYQGGSSGMRGLTAIQNPQGEGEVLLMSHESPHSKILYIDPQNDYAATEELDLNSFLLKNWGWLKDGYNEDTGLVMNIAYDDMEPVTNPKTSEQVHLLSFCYYILPADVRSGWYLIRHSDASYTLHEVPYIFDFRGSDKHLSAVRSIKVSPFTSDAGNIVYFAGYSPWRSRERTLLPVHNTAWIYSADIGTVLGTAKNQ